MLKKLNAFLSGIPMTAVGGVCLIVSFAAPRLGLALPFDPAWAAVVICGIPLLYLSVWRIIYNPGISKISSALLITIAMFAAIAIGDLFAAGEVAFIMSVGAILEEMTTERAKKGLKKLIGLAPVRGRRIDENSETLIPAEEIRPGDVLRILPGETIPVDGIIAAGESSVDQSVMTGESLPIEKGVGDEVYCGTLNRWGSIDIKASRVGEDSSLQKLIRLVQNAEKNQAPIQRIADTWAVWLVPAATLIAIIAGIVTRDITRAVTILVVFCPCALVLATPTAVMAAIGQATRRGVIIKSGEALEKMGRVDTIAFDKTGTLTTGTLTVSDVAAFGRGEEKLLAVAASVESRSEHPLGKAICADVRKRGIALSESSGFRTAAGGVSATVDGRSVHCGSEKYLAKNGIPLDENVSGTAARFAAEGKAVILVAEDGVCTGVIALSDTLRPEAPAAVGCLKKMGLRTVLLTGDTEGAADRLAAQLSIDEVHAGLLPEEKVALVERLRSDGRMLCMVGDGVNDAPALKAAPVGAAMGSMGSDIAIEAADIALMGDDLTRLAYLKRLSNAAIATIRFSITLSMCINAAAVTLSALGKLTPTTGALVHNAGSCFVVLIAALLYDRKFD